MKNIRILLAITTLTLTFSLLAGCKHNPTAELGNSIAGSGTVSPEQQAPILSTEQQPAPSTEQQTAADTKQQNTTDTKKETTASSNQQTDPADQLITEAEAKQKALAHAKLDEKNVTFAYTEFDTNDGVQVYEIEFYTDSREYDYDINAVTGAVIEYDYEAEHYSKESTTNDGTAYITEARAKEIVLNNSGLKESDVTFVRVKLDRDDGRMEYELEFYKDKAEYDYEVDAVTGEILSFDTDAEKYTPPVDATKFIGNEKAKKIALDKAGVAEADAVGLRIELEIDDGKSRYEVEFYNSNIEYSCEIDAITGNIVEFEADND